MPNDFIEGEGGEQVLGEGAGENVLPEFQPEDRPPSPSDKFPTTPAACNPLLDAPVEEQPCNPESDIETPVIAACAPLNITQTTWTSTKCFTAECPPGLISYILGEGGEQILDEFGNPIIAEYSILAAVGEPVTRCATATSNISQADADAQALALAQALAEGELICQLTPVLVELASLNITLLGDYFPVPFEELASLNISLSGTYGIAPHSDSASLMLEIEGEYILMPFIEEAAMSVSLSPISQYALVPFIEYPLLSITVTGSYNSVTVPFALAPDRGSLSLSMSGTYTEVTVGDTAQEEAELVITMAGSYVLKVIPEELGENASLALTTTGNYIFRIIDAGTKTETGTLSLSLSGNYHL